MKPERFLPAQTPPADNFGKDLERNLDRNFEQIREILTEGILLDDNLNGFRTTITTDATPGVETVIAHGLKRAPIGFLVLKKDKAAHIYSGATADGSTNLYVRSDVASVTATLFIL